MFRCNAAPWPTSLKAVSAVATIILIGVSYATAVAIPHGTRVPFAEAFGALIAFVPPAIGLGALLFVVRGYEVGTRQLSIGRLLWSTHISLDGLSRAWHDPAAMTGSMRVFGNGGLYSFTGHYRSRALGGYRAFVTDPKRAVVLRLAERTLVLSPADPAEFLRHLQALVPGIDTTTPG